MMNPVSEAHPALAGLSAALRQAVFGNLSDAEIIARCLREAEERARRDAEDAKRTEEWMAECAAKKERREALEQRAAEIVATIPDELRRHVYWHLDRDYRDDDYWAD